MKKNICLSILFFVILMQPSFAQSKYLNEGNSGLKISTSYLKNSLVNKVDVDIGYSILGYCDLGLNYQHNLKQKSNKNVSFYFNVNLLKNSRAFPFSILIFAKYNFLIDQRIDSTEQNTNLSEVGGSLFRPLFATRNWEITPEVGIRVPLEKKIEDNNMLNKFFTKLNVYLNKKSKNPIVICPGAWFGKFSPLYSFEIGLLFTARIKR